MSVLFLLLAASLLLGSTFLVLFVRAVRSGQYEDTITPAMRVLADDEPRAGARCRAPSGAAEARTWNAATRDVKKS